MEKLDIQVHPVSGPQYLTPGQWDVLATSVDTSLYAQARSTLQVCLQGAGTSKCSFGTRTF